jgi:TatD DNase family protein
MNPVEYELIDTHCHLTDPALAGQVEAVLARAAAAKVTTVISVATDVESAKAAIAQAERFPGVFAAAGVHPHEAGKVAPDDLKRIEELAAHPKVVAVGEIGIDYHYDFAPRDVQQRVFGEQVALAGRLGKPVIIHSRGKVIEDPAAKTKRTDPACFNDIVRILDERLGPAPAAPTTPMGHRPPVLRGVFHCFEGTAEQARAVFERGFLVSFTGSLTFKNNSALRAAAATFCVDHVMVETDSPYLSPEPMRKVKPNEPRLVVHTAETLAELHKLNVRDVARVTSVNARRLFGLPGLPAEGHGTFVYPIRDSMYINLTNKCSALCTFCPRVEWPWVKGHYLGLAKDPVADEVLAQLDGVDLSGWNEFVFCGFGEPTLRFAQLKEVAAGLKMKRPDCRIRLNTIGHGNILNKRDICPEMVGLIDEVSVSLDTADAAFYDKLVQPFIKGGFDGMQDFIRRCVAAGLKTTASAVNAPGVDIDACRRMAEALGVPLRVRQYNETG